MKKILTLLFALMMSFNIKAQCPLTEAIDFTATDCYGEEEINLFEILDRGQYVLIDFYFYSCYPCQQACPYVIEAYEAFGCNQHDVFFMEITPFDSDELAQWWAEHYGVSYPTISRDGGGFDIDADYQIPQYPTLVLISPDREILLGDIYPVESAQTIIDALTAFGIEEHSCEETPDTLPEVEITLGEVTANTVQATFTPNDDCASYHIMMDTQANMDMWVNMMGVSLEDLVVQWGIEKTEAYTHTWTEQIPNTEYTIYALPKDADGNAAELNTITLTTEAMGGTGTSVIDLQVEVTSSTSVFVTATPNEETAEYHYILIEKTVADSLGEEATMQILYDDPYPLYEVDEWEWIELTADTEYYAIAQGKNANGEWGEVTKLSFVTTVESYDEMFKADFAIFPNPADDKVYLRSDEGGEAEIKICDMTGRCVKNVKVSDIRNAVIDIADLEKGIYLINIEGKLEKLVVK